MSKVLKFIVVALAASVGFAVGGVLAFALSALVLGVAVRSGEAALALVLPASLLGGAVFAFGFGWLARALLR